MKQRLLALAMTAALALSLTACSGGNPGAATPPKDSPTPAAPETTTPNPPADSDLAYVQGKGTLVVGITEFAPMDYRDDAGSWIGFDADMAKAVAEKLEVKIEFVEIDWDNKIMELESKSIDCVWNGMTLTPEVMQAMETTNAYCSNAQVVVVAADKAEEYATAESLSALSFAVEAGSAGEAAVQEKGYEFTAVQTQADALLEVASGSSDACVIDLLMAGAMIGEGTSYPDLAHTVKLTTEEYGIGFRKGSDLAAKTNEILAQLYADGVTQTLGETYQVKDALVAQ